MAKIRLRGNNYVARIRWRMNGKVNEKEIPLLTSNKKEAKIRCAEVTISAPLIKADKVVLFPWQNHKARTEIIPYDIQRAMSEWIESLIMNRIKQGTIKIYTIAIKNLIAVSGSIIVTDIHFDHIENLKKKLSNLSDATINMRLRAIQTFLN